MDTDTILISSSDHSYTECELERIKVVVDKMGNYFEYVGDEHLEPDDEVVYKWVAVY